MNHKKVVS